MKSFFLILFLFLNLYSTSKANDKEIRADDLFHIDKMNSYNNDFALYFKSREKPVLARGEISNYMNDFPKDLYIYDYNSKKSSPLISYEWFPTQAKYHLQEYDFPIFPDDFAYYLLRDNQTLIMISAVKSLRANFKFDIVKKKLEIYPASGKFEFIISSFAKNCGHYKFESNYECSFYKPLISSNLIN